MVMVILLAAGAAACDSVADGPPGAVPTMPATSPTAGPGPGSGSETIDGVPVLPLEIAGEAQFPEDVALIIETGCWQCDGPTTGLERVYRGPSGEVRVETLFSPERLGLPPRLVETDKGTDEEEPTITGFALTPNASRIVVAVCSRGWCGPLGAPTTDAQTTIFESTDGGVTWQALDVLDGAIGVRAITVDGLLLQDPGAEAGSSPYRFYPSGRPLEPPAGAVGYRVFATADLVLWGTRDGRLLRSDGSEFQALDLPAGSEITDVVVQSGSAPLTAVVWYYEDESGSASYYLELVEPGRFRRLYRTRDLVRLGGWSGPLVYGNAGVEPDNLPVPPPEFYLGWLPAAFDLQGGAAVPVPDPFLQRQGRNLVQAVVDGPFARVRSGDTCLYLRTDPGRRATPIDCLADGVLLRDTGDREDVGGETWLRVLAPDGTEGWASAAYLQH